MRTPRLIRTVFACFCAWLNLVGAVSAQEKRFELALPEALAETGLPKYLLPRFALKHGTRITIVAPGQSTAAEIFASRERWAVPVFAGGGATYYLRVDADNPHAARFDRWVRSDIGKRTISGFPGNPKFTGDINIEEEEVQVELTGSAANGEAQSLLKCGRCHVVSPANRMNGIGSTPSFFVLRALSDWNNRFESFYARKPHPSFTQIPDVTDPFSDQRPPPIHPLTLSLDDLDDILAYVSGLTPANLGAPIQHQ